MSETNADDKSPTSSDFMRDFTASIVVFLVALPLCMGIAIASGAPVSTGLLTGIVGGIVVGTIAGCPLQVSGPAAGLTVIVYSIINDLGLELMGVTVLCAGVFQFLAGILRLGQWFRAVSPAVIKGMLSGIGVLIFASQCHVMVDDAPKKGGLQNLATIPEAIQKGIPMPKWTDTEDRQIRRDHLVEFGNLHERQVQLHERVAEQVAAHPDEEEIAREKEEFRNLATEQKEVTDALLGLKTELAEYEFTHTTPEKAEKLKQQLRDAIEASQLALKDLETGKIKEVKQAQEEAEDSLAALMGSLKNHEWAAKVGLLTILVIAVWQTLSNMKIHVFKVIPAPLVAVVGATALTAILSLPVLYVEIPDNLFSEIHFPSMVVLADAPWKEILQGGLLIAVVASAETLLCATAVDQMHRGPRTKYDKELAAQGVGNIVCGFLGALPMTGVIVRSAANVQAGGRTRKSAIMHGFWLLIFVAFLSFLLRMIPTAALAAMLVYTGIKLMSFRKNINDLRSFGKGEVAVYLVTVATIVSVDLLSGVVLGIVLSALKLLHSFSHLDSQLVKDEESKRATLSLNGAATFLRLPQLAEELERVPPGYELHVDFQNLDYIDHASLDLLRNWSKQHESMGGTLIVDWSSLQARFDREDQIEKRKVATTQAG